MPLKPIIPLVGLDPVDPLDLLPKHEEPLRPMLVHPPSFVDDHLRHVMLARAVEQQKAAPLLVGLERVSETSMECRCGGKLFTSRPNQARRDEMSKRLTGVPPRFRSFRFRNQHGRVRMKWADRRTRAEYETKLRMARLADAILSTSLFNRSYLCDRCGRPESIYQAVARNAFKIEPMPPGALPIYDRDPDVASIVTGDGDG